MNADESRRFYAGVELPRTLACSEVRDQTSAHRRGRRVRLMFFSAAAYRKIRMHGLGLCAIPDLDSRSVERAGGDSARKTPQTRKCRFKHLLLRLPAPLMPRPHSMLRYIGKRASSAQC